MNMGFFSKDYLVALPSLPAGGGLQAVGQCSCKHLREGSCFPGLDLVFCQICHGRQS